jgi:acyl-[acyl-carrier-protein]-phospholipid O-acyltransferase/long-chain-fatty-acid--[acyl-carrier-protein] ligase
VPDPVKGESIVLLFAGEEATEELVREKVKSVKLPPLMQPSFYIKLDVLPKLGSGKSDFIKSKAVAIEKLASKK